MSRLFLGNFAFEHQLAGNSKASHLAIGRIAAELSSVCLAVAEDNDVAWMPEIPEAEFPQDMADQGFPKLRWVSNAADLKQLTRESSLTVCPWGWSQAVIEWAERFRLPIDPPPLAATRAANSRRFSFALERELHLGLDGSAELSSLEDCQRSLAAFSSDARWVIKSEFGMSARERILGRRRELSAHQIAWAAKRLQARQRLFLEPWVDSLGEAGLQFEVPKAGEGEPSCIGMAPMLTDATGAYRGSRFDGKKATDLDWTKAVEVGVLAAKCAQSLGYFGPLGIDAMWYRDRDGSPKLRPLQDINARWTMGRLSLGFHPLLSTGEFGAWLHLRSSAQTLESAQQWWRQLKIALPKAVRLLRTSPLILGGKPVHHATAVMIAPDEDALRLAIALAVR